MNNMQGTFISPAVLSKLSGAWLSLAKPTRSDFPVRCDEMRIRVKDRWTWSDLSYDAYGNQRPVHSSFYQLGRELIESSERTVADYVLGMSNRPALKLPEPKDGKHISHRNARRLRRR